MKITVEVSLGEDQRWRVRIDHGPTVALETRIGAELLIGDRVMTQAEMQLGQAKADNPRGKEETLNV